MTIRQLEELIKHVPDKDKDVIVFNPSIRSLDNVSYVSLNNGNLQLVLERNQDARIN